MTSPAPRTWSTDPVAPRERFAYWREIVCAAFLPLRPEPVEPATAADFHGRVAQRELGFVGLSQIVAAAQRVTRLDPDETGIWFANLQVRGGSRITQAGRTNRLAAGDLVLLDASRPYTMAFDGPFEQLCVRLSAAALGADVERLRGVRVARATGLPALVAANASAGLDEDPDGDTTAARVVAGELLQQAVVEAGRGVLDARASHRSARRRAALRTLRRRAHEPGLAPADVAAELGVSVRTLHTDLRPTGRSFGRHLSAERVRRAAGLLRSRPHLTVAEVAARAGFGDLSGFNRAFRRELGTTPSDHRSRS